MRESAPASVIALGAVPAERFESILHELSHELVQARDRVRGSQWAARLVLTDDYLRDELAALNEESLRDGSPWLLVKPVGRCIWIGPFFQPGATACWACLAQRLRANRPIHTHIAMRNGRAVECTRLSRGWSDATLRVAASLATVEMVQRTHHATSAREGILRTLDVGSWTIETHTLVQRPQCPACGHAPEKSFAPPVTVGHRRKTYTSDGGHRVVRPESTLARYAHHVSPVTGVVPLLEPLSREHHGVLHVFRTAHSAMPPQFSLRALRGELRKGCAGKGASDAQARASGLCEALERYSATFTGDEPRRPATFTELGDAAIHPNECMLFSPQQYRERDIWNERQAYYCLVPRPFDPRETLEWSPVWSLTRNEVRYLPTSHCYFDYPSTGDEYAVSSNGLAAGNTVEEAIFQGLLELIERDSCALWWYNRVRRPRVDVERFEDPFVEQFSRFLVSKRRELWVLDLTTDLGVPVFAAVSRRTEGPERILFGFGAHLDPRIALLRCVTELAQMLTWILPDAGEERLDDSCMAPITARWLRTSTLENQPYLAPADEPSPGAQSYRRRVNEDLEADIAYLRSILEQRGMEVLALDLTRADIELPTVRVIVPGLRPLWARFAPGRLYDVPMELGWLERCRREADLNPIPMFL